MASFFGGSSKTTTTVKPNPAVANMLKGILKDSEKLDSLDFIQHRAATLNPNEQQAINSMAASGNLRAINGALSPRLQQGIEQSLKLNQTYENAANNNISYNDVLKDSNALRNGLYKTVQTTAASAGNVANRLGSATARSVARRGASQQQASSALNPYFTNRAIEQQKQNQANTLQTAGMLGNVAEQNQSLGLSGVNAGQQALQNQLTAGNIMQGYQNALFKNDQANQQGANDFIWNKIAAKQNILGNVSNMAGYKSVSTGQGVSRDRQLLGAGVAGLGMLAKGGYLNSNTQNAWDSYNQNGGQAGVAGPVMGGGNLSQQPAQQNPGFWSNAWTGATQALSGMVGG